MTADDRDNALQINAIEALCALFVYRIRRNGYDPDHPDDAARYYARDVALIEAALTRLEAGSMPLPDLPPTTAPQQPSRAA